MATKTTDCSECGAAVAPGRYACAECGALLAAVASAPRMWLSAPLPTATSAARQPPPVAAPGRAAGGAPAGKGPARPAAIELRRSRPSPAPQRPRRPAPPRDRGGSPATRAPGSDQRDPLARVGSVAPVPPSGPPAASKPAVASAQLTLPVWPPAGDAGPMWPGAPVDAGTPTVSRTPAGAYLAPSAVLPPLDAPKAVANGHVHLAPGGANALRSTMPASNGAAPRPSLVDSLDAFGITSDMPRRLVGGGAAMGVLGFLLPWITPIGGGSSLIDGYLDFWGLAGPGHWIVVVALLGLVTIAFADRPFGRLRIGAMAIFAAALLVGLLWPYLFGATSKSVGVWTVFSGAILVAAGGALDLRRRHAGDASAV